MGEKQFEKGKTVRDFNGRMVKLVLVKKDVYEDKDYDLYTVCKVIGNGKDRKLEPLYDETFTPKQVEAFYDKPDKQ